MNMIDTSDKFIKNSPFNDINRMGEVPANPFEGIEIKSAQASDRLETVFLGRHKLQGVTVGKDLLEGTSLDIRGQTVDLSVRNQAHAVTANAAVNGHGGRCFIIPGCGILSLTLAAMPARRDTCQGKSHEQ